MHSRKDMWLCQFLACLYLSLVIRHWIQPLLDTLGWGGGPWPRPSALARLSLVQQVDGALAAGIDDADVLVELALLGG